MMIIFLQLCVFQAQMRASAVDLNVMLHVSDPGFRQSGLFKVHASVRKRAYNL